MNTVIARKAIGVVVNRGAVLPKKREDTMSKSESRGRGPSGSAERKPRKVLILISGGPDSATLAKLAERERKDTGGTIAAIYLKTGHPKDNQEIEAARNVASRIGAELEIIDIAETVQKLGGGQPTMHAEANVMPLGNTIVMLVALAYSMRWGYDAIAIGLHADDAKEGHEYSRTYFDRLQEMAKSAYENAADILTPFINIDKVEVFRLGSRLGVDFSVTWSCMRGGKHHCGTCGPCIARHRAFAFAGLADPTTYAISPTGQASVA
jgi:7-cyano-7-deazaguanine synthase